MLGVMINLLYLCLLLIASPFIIYKQITQRKYTQGARQKLLGLLPTSDGSAQSKVWFHAVSVGEVLQLRQVIDQFREAVSDANILITTTTQTGYAVALEKFPDAEVAYFPMDFTWSVRNALQRVKPDLVVLVELELWPNFIRIAHSLDIPLVIINGRLSENSFKGYQKIRPLMSGLLQRFKKIACQADEYAERLIALGSPSDKVITTGSIKFDGVRTDRGNPKTLELRTWLHIQDDEQVLIAGSTQDPEEAMVLDIYSRVIKEFPKLRLIVVPRHPERGEAIATQIQQYGFSCLCRSTGETMDRYCSVRPATVVVGLLDTVGELGGCWGLADVAFVGGSFGNRGGQNMLEPAAFGAATCFGPNTKNFKHIVELLLAADGAKRVNSKEELEQFIRTMLSNQTLRAEMGTRAQSLVLNHQGATRRTIQILQDCLN